GTRPLVPAVRRPGRRRRRPDGGGPWRPGASVAIAGDLLVEPCAPVRVLHAGVPHARDRVPARSPLALGRGDPRGDGVEPVSVHRLPEHPARRPPGRRRRRRSGSGAVTRARPLLRVEDGRLLAGRVRFVDDVDLPGQLWLRVVRSQVAHANLLEVDTVAARASERVHAVLTAADLPEIARVPGRVEGAGRPLAAYREPVLARERGRYVGEPVAVVLAEDPYAAEDAAELVAIEYEELPVVLDLRAAGRGAALEVGE